MTLRLLANVLAIGGAATFVGAMLNIGLTLGAYWKGLPPAAFLDWFAENSHLIGRTIPLFAVPTLVGLTASLLIDWSDPASRNLWLAALGCVALLALVTVGFHLPTNAAFVAKSIPLDQVPARLDQWLWLHWVRIALGLTTSVLGIVAIAR